MPVYKNENAKKNQWWVQFTINGKRYTKRGFKTKKDAERALAEMQNDVHKGSYVVPQKVTFGIYLDQWLDGRQNITEETKKTYRSYCRTHIDQSIGSLPLEKLNPIAIQSFMNELREKGLADNTLRRIFSMVHASLNAAERMGLVQRNPANKIEKPKAKKKQLTVWEPEVVSDFLEKSKHHTRYWICIYLAVMTGMRQGEILGLRWSDIDFDRGTISIQQTLSHDGKKIKDGGKTSGSVRAIAISPETIRILKDHRTSITQELLQDGIRSDLVICTQKGNPVNPRMLYKAWTRLMSTLKVPEITFHDLRHTHASLLLKQGVHPKVVSERLGHSSITLTLDTYSHLLPNLQEQAAKGLDDLLSTKQQVKQITK
jgi:integrase